jgi:lipopolysaccharide biosynthesis glycosyltransferase
MSASGLPSYMGERLALATVLSDNFLPGALTMIRSFIDANPWFSGDIIVIYDGLTEQTATALKYHWPNIMLRKVGAELTERMAAVAAAAGWQSNKQLQFASLEAFALEDYDRVIFCDSDILFLASIEHLLAIEAPLIACGDGANFRGNLRRISDFAEVTAQTAQPKSKYISDTFNTGMMIIRMDEKSRENYGQLVAMMDPQIWRNDQTGHTDQMLLNIYFAGQQTIADPSYNYLMSHRALIEKATGIDIEKARAIHFTGPAKPWLGLDKLRATELDQPYFEAYRKWRGVYSTMLGPLANAESPGEI